MPEIDSTKHGPQVHGPPLWTRSMDPFMDPIYGLPLWTTPQFVNTYLENLSRSP